MKRITESDIELFAIEQLENVGYHYIYSPIISPKFMGGEVRAKPRRGGMIIKTNIKDKQNSEGVK